MTITATNGFKMITFTWNDDLSECNHVAIGITDKDFNDLIKAKVHEGCDFKNWTVTIK
jgi:hypothetical protein